MSVDETMCSMCESWPAREVYGLPVCITCYRSLMSVQATLEDMEAADPKLKELGEAVERSARRYIEERGNIDPG